MKELMLIAVISLFAAGVNAQNPGPNELHCTEEAFTFRADIRQGWHFSAPAMGASEIERSTSTYERVWDFKWMDALPELPPNAERQVNADSFNELVALPTQNITFYPLLYHAKIVDQPKYLFPCNFPYPYQTGKDSIKLIIQDQIHVFR